MLGDYSKDYSSDKPWELAARVKATRRRSSDPYPRARLPARRHNQINRLLDELTLYLDNLPDDTVSPDCSSHPHITSLPSFKDVGIHTDPVVILPAGSPSGAIDTSDTDTAPDSSPSSPASTVFPRPASPSYSPTSPASPFPEPSSPASVIMVESDSEPGMVPDLFDLGPFSAMAEFLGRTSSPFPSCNCFL
ncbi:hypothetical protein HF521_003875 [Silurus meridionalis]|uniref:Uncharacterized protein n=1 Tax=Silurus meridionalis TaxID=175797 RepID=A0A8T0AZP5_SILME|nr:hypothetical protein HF521_003875 [Silurus meridionalis]